MKGYEVFSNSTVFCPLPLPASPKCNEKMSNLKEKRDSFPKNPMLLAFSGMPKWADGKGFNL